MSNPTTSNPADKARKAERSAKRKAQQERAKARQIADSTLAQSLACPDCSASRGQPCQSTAGKPLVKPHGKRLAAAQVQKARTKAAQKVAGAGRILRAPGKADKAGHHGHAAGHRAAYIRMWNAVQDALQDGTLAGLQVTSSTGPHRPTQGKEWTGTLVEVCFKAGEDSKGGADRHAFKIQKDGGKSASSWIFFADIPGYFMAEQVHPRFMAAGDPDRTASCKAHGVQAAPEATPEATPEASARRAAQDAS